MLKVTPAAAEQIFKAAESGGMQGMGLRVAAKKKPDGSIEYGMGFDQPAEEDIRIQSGKVEILIAEVHQDLLENATMDFVELEPGQFSFIFLNPKDDHYVPPREE